MVRVYCDICGSEINKQEKEFRLECLMFDKDKEQYKYFYKCENVCEECIDRINNHIRLIKESSKLMNKDGD